MTAVPLPCPFCGSPRAILGLLGATTEITAQTAGLESHIDVIAFRCPRCGARGPEVTYGVEGWDEEALRLWNARPRSPLTPYGEQMRELATLAQNEAKAYTDRGLLEAIYVLLRRNDLVARLADQGRDQ